MEVDPDNKAFLSATVLLPIFPLFHASAEHDFVDAMPTKQSCISYAITAARLLSSLNKIPIFESICNNTFFDFCRQSSIGPEKYRDLFSYVEYGAKTLVAFSFSYLLLSWREKKHGSTAAKELKDSGLSFV